MDTKVCPASRAEWRKWLEKHHEKASEVWLVYYKKHTGKATLSYRESLEEALCFGWIDGIKKSIDDERYCHRFSPRRPNSQWSPRNIRLAQSLIRDGLMTSAGLACFKQRRPATGPTATERSQLAEKLHPEIEARLAENAVAWNNFRQLPPGYRRQYTAWLNSAKRPGTRDRRIAEALRLLELNRRLGMK